MNIEAFISAFKTELRRHGDIYHVDAVDQAIRAGVTAGVAAQEPVADNGELATALIAGAVDPTADIAAEVAAEPEPSTAQYDTALKAAEPSPSEFEE